MSNFKKANPKPTSNWLHQVKQTHDKTLHGLGCIAVRELQAWNRMQKEEEEEEEEKCAWSFIVLLTWALNSMQRIS